MQLQVHVDSATVVSGFHNLSEDVERMRRSDSTTNVTLTITTRASSKTNEFGLTITEVTYWDGKVFHFNGMVAGNLVSGSGNVINGQGEIRDHIRPHA